MHLRYVFIPFIPLMSIDEKHEKSKRSIINLKLSNIDLFLLWYQSLQFFFD